MGPKVSPAGKPAHQLLDQFLECLAAVMAGRFFMRLPPDPLPRVDFGSIRGQKMQPNLTIHLGQVGLHCPAAVEPRIVADDANHPVLSELVPQMLEKSGRIPSGSHCRDHQPPCHSLSGVSQLTPLVLTRGDHHHLQLPTHPAGLRLGTKVKFHFVLKDACLLLGHSADPVAALVVHKYRASKQTTLTGFGGSWGVSRTTNRTAARTCLPLRRIFTHLWVSRR